MKFLLVSPFTNASGSSVRFWNIALHLQKQGHKVVLVERKGNKKKPPIYFSSEITYYTSPSTGNLIGDILISLLFNVFILIRHFNCSVFYALKPAPNNCIPAFIAKVFGKKIILDIDDLDYAYWPDSKKRSIARWYFDSLSKMFPLITYHTPNLKKYLVDKVGVPESKTYYLAQGVSDAFLDVDINQPRIPKSIIYVATLSITSDFDKLIPMLTEVCKVHPDTHISVVGDGVRRYEFESLIKKYAIDKNVSFKGVIPHKELPSFICQHQIGLNYMEPSEVNDCRAILKLREYCACGLQVVCNISGDSVLFNECIYAEKEIESIQTRLINLLNTPFSCNKKGYQEVLSKYRWQNIMEHFVKQAFEIV
jgi:glycosyltransferase involved in cell wall biosynthesis